MPATNESFGSNVFQIIGEKKITVTLYRRTVFRKKSRLEISQSSKWSTGTRTLQYYAIFYEIHDVAAINKVATSTDWCRVKRYLQLFAFVHTPIRLHSCINWPQFLLRLSRFAGLCTWKMRKGNTLVSLRGCGGWYDILPLRSCCNVSFQKKPIIYLEATVQFIMSLQGNLL